MNTHETLFPMPKIELSETQTRHHGNPRVKSACRIQYEMQNTTLDELIDENHPVRSVWRYVESLDLSEIYETIQSVDGNAGRPAIDPKILVALWLYATIEGIGSAYVLTRYCREHNAFRWICGGVDVERRTITNFRVSNNNLFENLLAQSVAVLLKNGLVELKEIAQDGIRVRASAGSSSFRREKTLKELLKIAQERVRSLRKEIEEDPAANSKRQQEAKKRAREDREQRIEASLKELANLREELDENRRKHRKALLSEDEKQETRVSTTDSEARIMKMADGGFRPAYNVQYATATSGQVILAVDAFNTGSDSGLLMPIFEKIKKLYTIPERWLADAGYKCKASIVEAAKEGCKVYTPVQVNKKAKRCRDLTKALPGEDIWLQEWRERMGTEEGKEIYKRRASTAECVNAQARQRGLTQFLVRGRQKVTTVATMYAIVHNMVRSFAHKLF